MNDADPTDRQTAGAPVVIAAWAARYPPVFSRENPFLPLAFVFVTAIFAFAFLTPGPYERYLADVPGPVFGEMSVAACMAPVLAWALYVFCFVSTGFFPRRALLGAPRLWLFVLPGLFYWIVAPAYGLAAQLGQPDLLDQMAGAVIGPDWRSRPSRGDMPSYLWFHLACGPVGAWLGLLMARLRRPRPEC